MAIIVKVPNKGFNEVLAGVQFINGEGIFEDVELAKNLADDFGYKIEVMEEAEIIKEEVKVEVKKNNKK